MYDLQSEEILWGCDASSLEWFAHGRGSFGCMSFFHDIRMLVVDDSPTWVFLGSDLSE